MPRVQTNVCLFLLSLSSSSVFGCDAGQSPSTSAPAASPPPPPPPAPPAASIDEASAPVAHWKQLDIQLATGVSLPQTTVDGTIMSFSVDYEFSAASPAPNARYAFMVRRQDGEAYFQEQPLGQQGNLMLVVPNWRPDDGPFHGSIVQLDARQQPIAESEAIELTGP